MKKPKPAISWTAETVENFLPPLRVSETQVNKQLLLITRNSQVCKPQTVANISNMIVLTRIITREYWESILVISVSHTETGGRKFSTVSAVQEIMPRD